MSRDSVSLTVFFEDPFWVGVFERIENGKLSVCKITFGAEPKDGEVYEFVLKNYYRLQYSRSVDTVIRDTKPNPKRLQRQAEKTVHSSGIGTKAQQALKLQYEQNKLERKAIIREKKEAEEKRLFDLRQQRKKEKHRGH